MKDREYLQEMAYIMAEKEDLEQKELRELDRITIRKPAKIKILKENEYGRKEINRLAVNPLPL